MGHKMEDILNIDSLTDTVLSMDPSVNNWAVHTTLDGESGRVSLMISQIVMVDMLGKLIDKWNHFYPVDQDEIHKFIYEWINDANERFVHISTKEITQARFEFVDKLNGMIKNAYEENVENTVAVELYYTTALKQKAELKFAINQFVQGILNAAKTSITDVTEMNCPMVLHLMSLHLAFSFSQKMIEKYGDDMPDIVKDIHKELSDILK